MPNGVNHKKVSAYEVGRDPALICCDFIVMGRSVVGGSSPIFIQNIHFTILPVTGRQVEISLEGKKKIQTRHLFHVEVASST